LDNDTLEKLADMANIADTSLARLTGVYKNNKLPCCGYELSKNSLDSHGPVYWNPNNQCVQCHVCGHVWVPRLEGFGD